MAREVEASQSWVRGVYDPARAMPRPPEGEQAEVRKANELALRFATCLQITDLESLQPRYAVVPEVTSRVCSTAGMPQKAS